MWCGVMEEHYYICYVMWSHRRTLLHMLCDVESWKNIITYVMWCGVMGKNIITYVMWCGAIEEHYYICYVMWSHRRTLLHMLCDVESWENIITYVMWCGVIEEHYYICYVMWSHRRRIWRSRKNIITYVMWCGVMEEHYYICYVMWSHRRTLLHMLCDVDS